MSSQKYPQSSSTTTTMTGVTRKRRNRYSQVVNHAKQDRKRREAYARQDKYDNMTLSEQLESTDPNGSKRQRARILAAMAKAEATPATTVKPTKAPKKSKKA